IRVGTGAPVTAAPELPPEFDGPTIARPVIPANPKSLRVVLEPASIGAAAAGSTAETGNVIASGRISGAAAVHAEGTDSPPTASALPSSADNVSGDRWVRAAGNSLTGAGPAPGQGSTPAQPLAVPSA